MVEQIEEIMLNPVLRSEITARAKKDAALFSIQKMGHDTEKVYQEALALKKNA